MSKEKRRHCRGCDRETMHDVAYVDAVTGDRMNLAGRCFLAIVTMGINEMDVMKHYTCQRCGRQHTRR